MKQKMMLTIMVISFLTISLVGQSIKIGVGGGNTILGGDSDFTTEDILNLSSGIHFGGKLIVGLPILPIQFTANIFQNTLSSDITVLGQELTTETNFLSVGLGAEMTLLPGPLQPYIAGELLYTSLGEPTINNIAYMEAESKMGVGVGAGFYFKLLPMIDLDFSAHYNMNTILSEGEDLDSSHFRLNILFTIL